MALDSKTTDFQRSTSYSASPQSPRQQTLPQIVFSVLGSWMSTSRNPLRHKWRKQDQEHLPFWHCSLLQWNTLQENVFNVYIVQEVSLHSEYILTLYFKE